MGGFIPERTFGHFETQTEAPRAPPVQRFKQRVVPGQVQQIALLRCHHDVLAMSAGCAMRGPTYALLALKNGPMALRLGVARASVVAAYEHLLAEGCVESRRGS